MTNSLGTQQPDQWQIALDSLGTLDNQSYDIGSYLHEITCDVSRLLKSDWIVVTIPGGAAGQVIASNLDIARAKDGFSIHANISEMVVQSGQSFLIEDISPSPATAAIVEYVDYLALPLRALSGAVIGTLCSFSCHPQQYDEATITIAEPFADRAALAIENYQLYRRQQRFDARLEAEVTQRIVESSRAKVKLIEHRRLAEIGSHTAMMVHEIRNPLTTIQMGLAYLAKLKLSRPAQARLALTMDEAQRLEKLVQAMLSYAKPQRLQVVAIEIDAFMQPLLLLLRSMPEAQGRLVEYTPFHSSVWILGDPDKLKQVFINLIRNACEAVAPGETIQCLVTVNAMDQICISVHNGGAPIPADALPQLAQPFYSTKATGTGLGLAIVKQIVESHNGKLLIESSETQGTIFTVRFSGWTNPHNN